MATVITRERPGRLVVCLDLDWRPQFRVDCIPSYKAHRVEEESPGGQADVEEVPDDLSPQVEMIVELLDAFGICTGGAEGFEADDVIGTLAAHERRDPVVVVSGDRDLLQVVRDEPVEVRVLYLGRGLTNATLMGPVEVADRYGVPADRAGDGYAELALLRGDPSDGLPGVPGVGEKTAATLLAQYGSLAADPGRRRRPEIVDWPKAFGPSCGRPPTTSRSPDRSCGWPPTRRSRSRRPPTPCRWWRPTRRGSLNSRPELGVGSSIARLQKALDALPEPALLGPTHLVGALVVLEGRGHRALGAVDADVAVEAGTLFDGRILTVVALDVFDVLRAVAVGARRSGSVARRHSACSTSSLVVTKNPVPEAQHEDHRDDDAASTPMDDADRRLERCGPAGGWP